MSQGASREKSPAQTLAGNPLHKKPEELGTADTLSPAAPHADTLAAAPAPPADLGSAETLDATRSGQAAGRPITQPSGSGRSSQGGPPVLAEGAYLLPVVAPGRYEVEGEFARGGLGRILKARDATLDRPVALKELLRSRGQASQRFVREALVTARLQHPAIVPVYEAGHWPDGSPFYAMKLVAGHSLDHEIAARPEFGQRLSLLPHVLAVCEAMAYAHSQGIIHRDLKPQNILLGPFGETVVIDWGLAKDLRAQEPHTGEEGADEEDSGGGLTVVGAVMGTPAYMPPEQAQGRPVDERADVYALGAILYHLLAGRAPYLGQSSGEILKQVVLGPPPPLEKAQPRVREDLRALVHKAMARDPAQRYPSAKELAEDLRRFQGGHLVEAHHYTTLALVRRFIRRHRVVFSVGGAALAVLVLLSIYGVRRVMRERDRANLDLLRAMGLAAEAEIESARSEQARAEADARSDLLVLAEARAALSSDPTRALAWLKRLSLRSRDWGAARVLAARAAQDGVADLYSGHRAEVRLVAVSPAGDTLATVSGRSVRLWSLRAEEAPKELNIEAAVLDVAFSPDGRWLAIAAKDGRVSLYDCEAHTSAPVPSQAHEGEVTDVLFSPDGATLVSVGADGVVLLSSLVRPAEPAQRLSAVGQRVYRARISADGRYLVAGGRESSLLVWTLATHERRELRSLHGSISHFRVSPDGRTLAAAIQDGSVILWDLESGDLVQTLRDGAAPLTALVFSADGRALVAGDREGRARRWMLETGAVGASWDLGSEVTALHAALDGVHLAAATQAGGLFWIDGDRIESTLLGHKGEINSIDLSPDGRWLFSGGVDQTARRWEPARHPTFLSGLEGHATHLRFSADGLYLAAAGDDGKVMLWPQQGERFGEGAILAEHEGPVSGLAFSPDSKLVASAGEDGAVRLLGVLGGGGQALSGHAAPATAVAFSPNGELLASADESGLILLWSAPCVALEGPGRCDPPRALAVHTQAVSVLAFSPDGAWLASAGLDGVVALWPTAGGEPRLLTGTGGEPAHSGPVRALAFSSDGRYLFSGGDDTSLWAFDIVQQTGHKVRGHEDAITCLVASPRGLGLASAGRDKTVRIWSVEARGILRERRQLAGHSTTVSALAFSPNGDELASADREGGVRLWDTQSGEGRQLPQARREMKQLAFSPRGYTLAAVGVEDFRVWVYADDLPREAAGLRAWLARSTNAEIDDQNRLIAP